MSAKLKAVEDIKKLGRMLKGIIDVAEDLESMGSIEQAILESAEQLRKAQTALSQVLLEKGEADSRLDSVNLRAKDIEQQALATAQSILKDAHEQADGILASCKADTQAIVQSSEIAKDRIDAQVASAKAELVGLEAQKIETQKAIDELSAQLKELRARLVL